MTVPLQFLISAVQYRMTAPLLFLAQATTDTTPPLFTVGPLSFQLIDIYIITGVIALIFVFSIVLSLLWHPHQDDSEAEQSSDTKPGQINNNVAPTSATNTTAVAPSNSTPDTKPTTSSAIVSNVPTATTEKKEQSLDTKQTPLVVQDIMAAIVPPSPKSKEDIVTPDKKPASDPTEGNLDFPYKKLQITAPTISFEKPTPAAPEAKEITPEKQVNDTALIAPPTVPQITPVPVVAPPSPQVGLPPLPDLPKDLPPLIAKAHDMNSHQGSIKKEMIMPTAATETSQTSTQPIPQVAPQQPSIEQKPPILEPIPFPVNKPLTIPQPKKLGPTFVSPLTGEPDKKAVSVPPPSVIEASLPIIAPTPITEPSPAPVPIAEPVITPPAEEPPIGYNPLDPILP